jgi:hypothetical protein
MASSFEFPPLLITMRFPGGVTTFNPNANRHFCRRSSLGRVNPGDYTPPVRCWGPPARSRSCAPEIFRVPFDSQFDSRRRGKLWKLRTIQHARKAHPQQNTTWWHSAEALTAELRTSRSGVRVSPGARPEQELFQIAATNFWNAPAASSPQCRLQPPVEWQSREWTAPGREGWLRYRG